MAGEIELAAGGGSRGNGSLNLETASARLGGGGVGEGNGSSTITDTTLGNLFERVEKKEEQILKIEATLFQVANYNLVFQGVILAAITNGSSALRCSLFYLPFSLSAVGSVLNFVILWINLDKYMAAVDELDKRSLVLYKQQYPGSSAKDLEDLHRLSKVKRWRILALTVILYFLFAALNLIAARMIAC